jgi:hypothetical protein
MAAPTGSESEGEQMQTIDQNLRELRETFVYLSTNLNSNDYPTEFQTYEEAWEELSQSLAHLRGKLGEDWYAQLVDMAAQAKAHYDVGYKAGFKGTANVKQGDPGLEDIKLGSWLMQDMEQLVKGKPPYAYPQDMYRWPRDENS